jgi:hypothetical protein
MFLSIGVIDKYLQYSPAYYSNDGYVHNLRLKMQTDVFGDGDTVVTGSIGIEKSSS